MKKIIFFILVSIFVFSSYAEKIKLKTGNVIEGNIVEETDEYIKVEFEGIPLTYYKNEISEISRNTTIQSDIRSNENTYINNEIGFSITAPANWIAKQRTDIRGNLVSFFSDKSKLNQMPDVGISVDTVGLFGQNNLKDFANAYLNRYINKYNFSVVEPVKMVSFKNASGMMYAILSPQGERGRFQIKHYLFRKNENIISLMFFVMEGQEQIYENYHKEILDTLKLTPNK